MDPSDREKKENSISLKSVASDESGDSTLVTDKQSKQQLKHDKSVSVRRKKLLKYEKHFICHDEVLESHIPYGVESHKSPNTVMKHWYYRVKHNSIVLSLKAETPEKKNRRVYYNIAAIGKNVRMTKKNQFTHLNVEGTKNNKILILVPFKDLLNVEKISFFYGDWQYNKNC